ncbi:MAG: hypothetical protein ABSC77_02740 [Terracidiphilus sp.]|jgi:hypothetical protein
MSGTNATREEGHPRATPDSEAVLRELQEILASHHFCNSKRYPAMLKYIVENTLAGKQDYLKERTIGVEVFDRPPTYDSNNDTVVRYTAGEVRKRLQLYYSESGHSSAVRITLPAGSYIPEFHYAHDLPAEHGDDAGFRAEHPHDGGGHAYAEAGESHRLLGGTRSSRKRLAWIGVAVIAASLAVAGLAWKYHSISPQTAVDSFWAPVLREQHTVIICTGSVVFAQNNFSGVHTAGRDIDYPFVSMQSATAITQISALLERLGASTELTSSATIPLTELREHTIILIGGYNNQWTLRLLQPLRFHFSPASTDSPDQDASIADQKQPQAHWARDHSLPYSSADDYALLARFRDATTDGWVVALAGLGRNGTEAAAQFATSPHYMQLLREQMGRDFANQNVEVLMKVNVVDGKTGAPSILAVHVW